MLLRALVAASVALVPAPTARVATGLNPCGTAAAFGAVWVANYGSGTLARVDPRTNRVTARIPVGRGACAVSFAAGKLWVTNDLAGEVLRVDPRTRGLRHIGVGGAPFGLVAAAGGVWATTWSKGSVVEIDPVSARVVRTIDVGGYPAGLAYADGAIWVGFGRDATAVARIDPASARVERVDVGSRAPATFARGTGDTLWIDVADSDLVRLDTRTRRVVVRLHVGHTLAQGVRAADGTLWIPDKEVDRVYRIDPRTNMVRGSFPAGDGAFHVLRAFGSMWVTSYAGADVWRFKG
jgi:YVTN family beta-propeller protein